MTVDRQITGGVHISGNAQVTLTNSQVAAGQGSSVTVHTGAVVE